MRQTLLLFNDSNDFVIKTVSEIAVLDLLNGDYEITDELIFNLHDIWGGIDMTGCTVRIVNG